MLQSLRIVKGMLFHTFNTTIHDRMSELWASPCLSRLPGSSAFGSQFANCVPHLMVSVAPTTGSQPAHHLGMCGSKLEPAWDLVCQAPATLFKWISAPMCCRIAHGEGAEGSFQLLDVHNMPTGGSQGCQILASTHAHDVAATRPWCKPQHPPQGVIMVVRFAIRETHFNISPFFARRTRNGPSRGQNPAKKRLCDSQLT